MAPFYAILVFFGEVYGEHIMKKDVDQPNALVTVQHGDSVTLRCFHSQEFISGVSWFKQRLGQKPQIVAISLNPQSKAIFLSEFVNITRFSAHTTEGIFNLVISQVEPSDSATYYCAITQYNDVTFGNGTTLLLTGPESQSRTVVLQQPESVQPGDSETLQCTVHSETCAGEYSVYWFRQASGESPPGIIHTHGHRSDECQRSSGTVSPTQSCVYNFPKRNLSLSDAGTYYCAVATCGEILFGNGTKLDVEEGKVPFFIVIIASVVLALSLIVNVVLLCTRRKREVCEHCTGNPLPKSQHDTTHDSREQCPSEDVLNYAALSFSNKNAKSRPKRRDPRQEPIYSGVRNHDWS
ncbi:uncharacterized protein LOC133123748 [Conger conger]|uniref:uncharacterized protein LOC133123748 n=1 Tax=Conger conger TaxID=82655 RepID=UPI002A59DF71|nr:uncharacterized protein LOC133123748 [Conger conger]